MKFLEPIMKKCYELLGIPKKDIHKKWISDIVAAELSEMNVKEEPISDAQRELAKMLGMEIKKPIDKRYKKFHTFFCGDNNEEDDNGLPEIAGKEAYKSSKPFNMSIDSGQSLVGRTAKYLRENNYIVDSSILDEAKLGKDMYFYWVA